MSQELHRPENWEQQCKQAYSFIVGNVQKPIKSKEEFLKVLQHTGRNPNTKQLNTLWSKNTKTISYEEFLDLCYTTPVTTKNDLLKAFSVFDLNKDGYISTEEFLTAMSSGEDAIQRKDLLTLLRKSDTDREGKLDYKEFATIMTASLDKLRNLIPKEDKPKEKVPTKSSKPSAPQQTNQSQSIPVTTVHKDQVLDVPDGTSLLAESRSTPAPILPTISPSPKIPYQIEYKINKLLELSKPKTDELSVPKDWLTLKRRGCFIHSASSEMHEITLTSLMLVLNTSVQMRISAQPDQDLLKDTSGANVTFILIGETKKQMAWSESNGSSTLGTDLSPGTYKVIPIYSGTHLNQSSSPRTRMKPQLVKKHADLGFILTTAAREAISVIFRLYDADMNDLWNKDEFCRFARQTYQRSDVEELWDAIQEYSILKNEQLSLDELVELFAREVQEDNGSPDCLWNALEQSGVNDQFELVGCVPIVFSINFLPKQQGDINLKVMGLNTYNTWQLEQKLTDWALEKGEMLSASALVKEKKQEEQLRIAFLLSSNCVLLAFESNKKLPKDATLMFKVNVGQLQISPIVEHIIRPELLVKKYPPELLFSAKIGTSMKNLLLLGTLPMANVGVMSEVTAGFRT